MTIRQPGNLDGTVVLLADRPDGISWQIGDEFIRVAEDLSEYRLAWDTINAGGVVNSKVTLRSFRADGGNSNLYLSTARTDWRETSILHLALSSQPHLAQRLCATVERTGVFTTPIILTVHVIVVLVDGNVLAVRRSREVRFHPGHWSVSFEEGIEPVDLQSADPLVAAVERGLLEELSLGADWVVSIDPLGLALEREIVNPGLLVRARVSLSSDEMADTLHDLSYEEWDAFKMVPGVPLAMQELHPTSNLRLFQHAACGR